MASFHRSHLTDESLLRELATHLAHERSATAELLADLAEVDARNLYARAAYDSMYEYCTRELHMSEETAFRRIRVARTARQFPAILAMLADGRLHMTAVLLLAPHLTVAAADELLAAATHKTKAEIDLLLAQRHPRPDVPTCIQPVLAPAASGGLTAQPADSTPDQLAPEPVDPSVESASPGQAVALAQPLPQRARTAPLSPGRYALQVTVDQETYEQLRHAQALLGHSVPSGDVAEVLKRALITLVQVLEKQRFAKTERPRPQRNPANGRHIPAAVRRAVRERDGGRCTFVSEQGKRCESRTRLEFDHIEAFARGGQATVSGIRLRCRAHNQYAADCTFGAQFMRGKRERGRVNGAPPRWSSRTHCAPGPTAARGA